jgi:hypothetical protein
MDDLSACSIVQLITAGPGWYARYRAPGRSTVAAVALWALIETDAGVRRIVGVAPDEDGSLSCHAEEAPGFERYVYRAPGSAQAAAPIPSGSDG